MISLYAIIIESAINRRKKNIWLKFSIFSEREFFPKKKSIPLRKQRSKSLPPSRAGIGSILNTHKFTEITAQSIMTNTRPHSRD